MLWLALHFHDLALQVFASSSEAPFAVGSPGQRPAILAANGTALALGVRPGMAVSAARALAPELILQPRNPRREAEALDGIATWALQFTPDLSLAPPEAVLLEIGGCLKLFGGLERLLERVRAGLIDLGLAAVPAVAPTPTGAQLLARAALELSLEDTATLHRHLAALSLDCLDQPRDVLAGLAHLGLRTLGDCMALPRAGLARRFGPALLDELDRAWGHKADPRPLFTLPEHFAARLELTAPVAEVEALLFGVKRLVTALCGWLAARNAGVRRLTLALAHERRVATPIPLALTTPQRDGVHLLALLRERLARQDLSAGVIGLELRADDTAQLVPLNFSLFGDRDRIRSDCLNLVERLQARLGPEAVSGLALYPEHRPELAWRESTPGSGPGTATFPLRPAWLLARPRSLGGHIDAPWLAGPMTILAGPERIESGWWDGAPVRRDYYQARAASGACYWIYLELDNPPRWFLHGLFA